MKTNAQSRRFLLMLFGVMYFVQGVITAYSTNFFKPHMASEGIDPDDIGLVASLALVPFIIKAIFGYVSDRYSLFGRGHRVPYMITGVIMCSVAFAIAFFIDPSENYAAVAGMVLMATFFMAFFDTTADAYAVDITPQDDEQTVQSWMTGGRAAGLIILSFIFGRIATTVGYNYIFLVISLCLLIPLFMLFRVQEPAQRAASEAFDWGALRAFRKPSNLLFALFLVVAWTTFQGIEGLVTFYMSEGLGIGAQQIGNYGTLKGVGMIIGALIASTLVARIGRLNASLMTVSLVTVLGFVFSTVTQLNVLLVLGVLWGIVVGLHWTVYATVSMTVTDIRVAGTMFAIFQTMANIGLGVGDGVTASLADNMSFSQIFVVWSVINIVTIPLFYIFWRSYAKTLST